MNIKREFSGQDVRGFVCRLNLLIKFGRRSEAELLRAKKEQPTKEACRTAFQLVWDWCSSVPFPDSTPAMKDQLPDFCRDALDMVVKALACDLDAMEEEIEGFWGTNPEVWHEPEIEDLAMFTSGSLPHLDGSSVLRLVEIDRAKPKPYIFQDPLSPNLYFAAPRDALSGVSVVRAATRGVYR
jgi:hypothetical protein